MRARKGRRHGSAVEVIIFRCPGCDDRHQVTVGELGQWGWNGSLDLPTFEGSVLVRGPIRDRGDGVCHSFIRDGRIEYLADSTHSLAGQTVDLPEER